MADSVAPVLRPLRWTGRTPHPDDLEAVARIYAAYERSRIAMVDTSAADNAYYFGLATVDRDETSLVEVGGEAVGVVYIKAEPGVRDVYADIAVDPGPHEHAALAVAVEHAVAAARRIVHRLGGEGWTLRVTCWEPDTALIELLRQHGLQFARRFLRMRIDSDSPAIPAAAPDLPPGVEIVVRDDEETRRAIWAVDNEAFLDHWNFVPASWEEWWDELGSGESRDPDGWWLLTVDGEPAAICLLDERRAEFGEGYVSVLGVRRQFRRRGLAGLLLQRAFVRYRDMGRSATLLGVDASNETGAVGVYERVGMRPELVRHGWALELT
ncbi:MAG: GNAT family N-acetyltransferase [Candidatus Nanopelagicales bacterium]